MKIFEFKKYTLKEIAALYDKKPRSFQTWLKPIQDEIGPKNGWDYSPAQVKVIVAYLGLPRGHRLPELTDKR